MRGNGSRDVPWRACSLEPPPGRRTARRGARRLTPGEVAGDLDRLRSPWPGGLREADGVRLPPVQGVVCEPQERQAHGRSQEDPHEQDLDLPWRPGTDGGQYADRDTETRQGQKRPQRAAEDPAEQLHTPSLSVWWTVEAGPLSETRKAVRARIRRSTVSFLPVSLCRASPVRKLRWRILVRS